MVFVLGINLPDKKLVHIALQRIYGIGSATSLKVCNSLHIHPQARLQQLSEQKIQDLSHSLNGMKLQSQVRNETRENIRALFEMGTLRGIRYFSQPLLIAHINSIFASKKTQGGIANQGPEDAHMWHDRT